VRRSPLLWAAALAVYAFLYVPLVVVVIFSFNDSKLSAEWVGFTTDWYRKLFENEEMLAAAVNSLVIAFVAAGLATVLGTMAGIAMHRYRSKILPFMVLTPIAMPEILLGVALLIFFISTFGAESLSLATVIVAHTTFCIGFVAIIVRARLAGMDESIFEAARDLGATP
jgi:spermidine/putrescine transport system permease protein